MILISRWSVRQTMIRRAREKDRSLSTTKIPLSLLRSGEREKGEGVLICRSVRARFVWPTRDDAIGEAIQDEKNGKPPHLSDIAADQFSTFNKKYTINRGRNDSGNIPIDQWCPLLSWSADWPFQQLLKKFKKAIIL